MYVRIELQNLEKNEKIQSEYIINYKKGKNFLMKHCNKNKKSLQVTKVAKQVASEDLTRKDRNVAGMDIGASSIFVCAGTSNKDLSVFEVSTFTVDLKQLIERLKQLRVESVAMEATGIYWITIYDMLEEAGIEPWLVNPRDIKAIPGKKTDVLDCQRIQQLHSYGMLKRSFRPDKEIIILRSYTRQRTNLTELAATQLNHMHKALVQMNIQIGRVLSDISGATGMLIIREIVNGKHDPLSLAKLRDPRCKSSESEIAKALDGHYKPEHLLTLRQALEIYDFLYQKIVECDNAVKSLLESTSPPDNQTSSQSGNKANSQEPLDKDTVNSKSVLKKK